MVAILSSWGGGGVGGGDELSDADLSIINDFLYYSPEGNLTRNPWDI